MQERISRPFRKNAPAAHFALQVHMMCEDFKHRIIPYLGNRNAYQLSTCGTSSHVVERSLAPIGLVPSYFSGTDDFIEAITYSLFTSHDLWLEVTCNPVEKDTAPFHVFHVEGVNCTERGNIIQVVPSPSPYIEQSQHGQSRNEQISLPSDRMVHATLPSAYPSEVLNRVIEELVIHNDLEALQIGLAKITGQSEVPRNFNFEEASRIRRLDLLQAASPIGWTAREILRYEQNRELNDYYYFLRELQFLHFVASVREQAEHALRDVLVIAGDQCGFSFSVTAQGIYTANEINGLIEQFTKGEIAFSDLNDIIHERASSRHFPEKRFVFGI